MSTHFFITLIFLNESICCSHTQLLQNAFRLFGVSDRPGVEKLLTEASDLVQSPSWQAVEVIVSRVRVRIILFSV